MSEAGFVGWGKAPSLPPNLFSPQAADDRSGALPNGLQTQCPGCGSMKLYRDGSQKSSFGVRIQKYLCLDCGAKFSDKADLALAKKTAVEYLKTLNVQDNNIDAVQISEYALGEQKALDYKAQRESCVLHGVKGESN